MRAILVSTNLWGGGGRSGQGGAAGISFTFYHLHSFFFTNVGGGGVGVEEVNDLLVVDFLVGYGGGGGGRVRMWTPPTGSTLIWACPLFV